MMPRAPPPPVAHVFFCRAPSPRCLNHWLSGGVKCWAQLLAPAEIVCSTLCRPPVLRHSRTHPALRTFPLRRSTQFFGLDFILDVNLEVVSRTIFLNVIRLVPVLLFCYPGLHHVLQKGSAPVLSHPTSPAHTLFLSISSLYVSIRWVLDDDDSPHDLFFVISFPCLLFSG